tara:strand:+ start:100 stop:870 length:771 start_codon:yes stop_codon:yes gene_type:complete
MPYPNLEDVSIDLIKFSKMYVTDNKARVDIVQGNGKKMIFSLCSDCQEPYEARYPLDSVRDDATDGTRRGQKIVIGESACRDALARLDEAVVQAALANAADWFKSKVPITEDMIRSRYQNIVFKEVEADEHSCMKFKVKTEGAKFPTKLHRVLDDGKILELKGRLSDMEMKGSKLAPILSSFGLWFMGGKDPSKFGVSFQAEEIVVTPGQGNEPLSNFSSKRKIDAVASMQDGSEEEESKFGKLDEDTEQNEGDAM